MELFYCSRCRHAIPPGGADEGRYFKLGDELICPKCYYKVKPGDHSGQTIPVEPVGDDRLLGANRIAPATPARPHKPPSATMAPVKPPTSRIMPAARRSASPSSARLRAVRGMEARKSVAIGLGVSAFLAVVLVAVFVGIRGRQAAGPQAGDSGSPGADVPGLPKPNLVQTSAQPSPKKEPEPPEPEPVSSRPELQPDVVVTSLSYSEGLFSCTVRNQGMAATPRGVVIGVSYLVDGVKKTWGAVSGPLAPGASIKVGTQGGSCTIPGGRHTIGAYADDMNRFAESDETNNTLTQTIDTDTGL